jgi:predicted dehydrogenase
MNPTVPQETSTRGAPLGVAVIGCGYWGPNLVRNFSTCPTSQVVMLCDRSEEALARVGALCPEAQRVGDFQQVLDNPAVAAIAIATPVATHAPLAKAALRAGKHVLLEKPMATSERDGEELIRLAERGGLTLMVDHTYVFSPPVRKIRELVQSGEIGNIFYIDGVRINLGLFQSDVNVLWDLAPHDLSIVDFLLGRLPRTVAASGASHTRSGQEDVAYLNLDFGGGVMAHFHVNWLSPVKVRHLIIAGSKKSIVYNDLNPWEPLKIYDQGIHEGESTEARHGAMISYRTGDIWSPRLEPGEPLQNVVRHYIECIQTKGTPISDGRAGLRVVRILEAAERSVKAQGGRITL